MIRVYLRDLLKERNMTLKELSYLTGISSNTLSSIQNEKKESIHFPTLDKITRALDIQVGDLIKRIDCIYDLSVNEIIYIEKNKYNVIFELKEINNESIITELVIPINLMNSESIDNKFIEIEISYEDLIEFKNNISDDALKVSIDEDISDLFEVISFLIVQEFKIKKIFTDDPFTVVICYLTTNYESLGISLLKKAKKSTFSNSYVVSRFISTLVPTSTDSMTILPDKKSLMLNELVNDVYLEKNHKYIIHIN